jgi:hypothetical protein
MNAGGPPGETPSSCSLRAGGCGQVGAFSNHAFLDLSSEQE